MYRPSTHSLFHLISQGMNLTLNPLHHLHNVSQETGIMCIATFLWKYFSYGVVCLYKVCSWRYCLFFSINFFLLVFILNLRTWFFGLLLIFIGYRHTSLMILLTSGFLFHGVSYRGLGHNLSMRIEYRHSEFANSHLTTSHVLGLLFPKEKLI